MQLAVRQEDADVLLKEKNLLTASVLDKYRTAGQIAESGLKYLIELINSSYHFQTLGRQLSVQELCVMGDSYIAALLNRVYVDKSQVREKGISHPTAIEVNQFTGTGFSPEVDDVRPFMFQTGDLVAISLGVHIDGYTANVSHTLVIFPPNPTKPDGPLLGPKADSVIAAHIAAETVVGLMALASKPEKLPKEFLGTVATSSSNTTITGHTIRQTVDEIARQFGCVVVPGSKVRRIRRFLAGQAEGIVAERDFKGVVWDELHQEVELLTRYRNQNLKESQEMTIISKKDIKEIEASHSAIPTDEFVVAKGEAYQVDIRMVSVAEFKNELGIVTIEEVDKYTGKNHAKTTFNSQPTIYVRDYAMHHQLKLKTSRQLLGAIDKKIGVFPFKLTHLCDSFPLDIDANGNVDGEILQRLAKEVTQRKLGANELSNRHLIESRPIQLVKFVPLKQILLSSNPTGRQGVDANKPVLPGMEIPLPNLGISSLKLKLLVNKHGRSITEGGVARELKSIVIGGGEDSKNDAVDAIKLTGNYKPSWSHSQYKLQGPLQSAIQQLDLLMKDKRFGISIRQVMPLSNLFSQIDVKQAGDMNIDN
ncbi:putative metalloprotease arx1 [Scheffersomyces spartinae]|uniref:Probable metalloprotease ARX1 n=1 Tax=Scheffersomyces spartinae TaxID=45513 RepID=A0A9P7V5J0_9ASCO|nr:putative metalloprotease arx1 [Scheffersomyces spartinae]KAG7191534.1 putative metalloprotease arx1 [Scheffersomyces spartinae]